MPAEQVLEHYWPALIAIGLWSIPWKGYALWKAARRDDRAWFVVLLIVNTMGLLDILYIFIWSKRRSSSDSRNRS
jgi:hypothetical protein